MVCSHTVAGGQPNVVYVQGQPQQKTVYVQDKGKSKGTGKMIAGTRLFTTESFLHV